MFIAEKQFLPKAFMRFIFREVEFYLIRVGWNVYPCSVVDIKTLNAEWK